MCNASNCSHDLDDSLDGLFEGPATPLVIAPVDTTPKGDLIDAPFRATVETAAAAAGHRYEERCDKCRGTGTWSSYSGMTRGECFACKGKGKLVFKSSPEARQKAAEARDAAKAKKALTIRDSVTEWLEANPADWAWLNDGAKRGFEVAASMLEGLHKYGSLTEKQAAAVTRMRIQSEERQAKWAAERAERESTKSEVNVDKISASLNKAKSAIKWPKLRLADFVFSLASATSANAGAVYVKTNDDVYLGKVVGGKFTRSRDCTPALEQAVLAAAADPEAAAVAYGKAFGRCSCCGRELTNPESIARSIGPICAERFGW